MRKLLPIMLLSLTISVPTIGENVKLIGAIKQTIGPQQPTHPSTKPIMKSTLLARANSSKTLSFLKLSLSAEAKKILESRGQDALNVNNRIAVKAHNRNQYPSQIQLGMNNVPVLSQGEHNTCVTFANTAAYDAALNKGDYISQLCQLALSRYLEKNTYNYPNGWDGSFGRKILTELEAFGIVNKHQQKSSGCGGMLEYPVIGPDPESFMTLEEYKGVSEEANLTWSAILEPIEAFSDRIDPNKILNSVKASLNAGDRLTFGSLLLNINTGYAGATGTYNTPNDSWVLTPQLARSAYMQPFFVGHEMIITGYDDNAVAIDEDGYEHYGLLTLRNSWGSNAGDHGDFYMSYDYFKLFVVEVHRIRGEDLNERI